MGRVDLEALLEEGRETVDADLRAALPPPDAPPARLSEAMHYALFGGGKRLRPLVLRLVCEGLGGSAEAARLPATALELVHTYSLVHDDLPCMDDDSLRRGRPTVHVAFDEATAVLVGDALLTHAFSVLARDPRGAEHAAILADAAGPAGMVGGQVIDLGLQLGTLADDARRVAVEDLHRRKTAALFRAATEMGAVAAGSDPELRGAAASLGEAMGMAFQAVDDLLDVTGDAGSLGKTPGKDAQLERATLVAAVGLEEVGRLAEERTRAARRALEALPLSTREPLAALVEYVLRRRR